MEDHLTEQNWLLEILTDRREKLSTILFFSKSKCEVVIAGDFNIDLLKLNENNNVRFFSTPSLAMLFVLKLHLLTIVFVNLVLKLQTM